MSVRSALDEVAPPRASAALRAALLAISGALCVLLAACGSGGAYVAPNPTSAPSIDPGRATTTLQTLQSAVRRGDATAARRLGADDASSTLLAAVARNVTAIGLGDVRFQYLTENGGGTFQGSWTATVQISWKVMGFDPGPAQTEVDVTFADDGRTISRIGGGQQATPLWLSGPVLVRRSPDVLVIATAPAASADALLAEAEHGLRRDHAVIGGAHKLVVEAPRTVADLQRALAVTPPTYAGIAAVTAPVDGTRLPGTPVHVFVNPVVFHGMDRLASQVVMTHESAHAVTNAPLATGVPLWLIEGFADYVALSDVRLPLSKTAGEISAQVRRHGAPQHLPDDGQFGSGDAADLGPTYEAAWLACKTISEHAGQPALVRFYQDALGGTPVARALPRDTGLTLATLTAAWRAKLSAVAAVAR